MAITNISMMKSPPAELRRQWADLHKVMGELGLRHKWTEIADKANEMGKANGVDWDPAYQWACQEASRVVTAYLEGGSQTINAGAEEYDEIMKGQELWQNK